MNTLGINDYGIYNVVGGVVSMFSFFTVSLSTAISRFLTYSLGKNDVEKLSSIFSTSINIQLIMALIVVVIAETFGMWFLNNKLNIPIERMYAANWVLHSSIILFSIQIITIPYHAVIIAHEKMDAWAYISVFESVLKLGSVLLLFNASYDLLILYASLLVLVQIIVFVLNWVYCNHRFDECHYRFVFDKPLIRNMSGFAGWNLVGTGAYMLNTQGVNMLTNIFFGVPANAARGIANQVNGLMMQFVNSFTTAINPQITKSYASGDLNYMFNLICKGAKYSHFLMLFFLVPLMFEIEWILHLWLDHYPPYAPIFLRLMIIGQMIDFLGNSTARAVWATGRVRKYYLLTSLIGPLVFPITYLLFEFGLTAEWSYWAFIVVYSILIPIRLHILKELIGFPPSLFYKEVVLPCLITTLIAFSIPTLIVLCIRNIYLANIVILITSLISVASSIWIVGLDNNERHYFIHYSRRFIKNS